MNNLRNFEISVWTLQDSFVTVLEDSCNKLKGKTQDASMTLNIDGTQELTFTIPRKFNISGQFITNPAWESTLNGQILVNTRKVKVILNKRTSEEEIYEFVIDKVIERHENDELYCDITCSGLAFYELGKIGYKVSLSSEDFYADDLSWFNEETDKDGNLLFEDQPIANLQYWVNKFLTKLEDEDDFSNNIFENNKWYYTIQMDWSHYANYPGYSRDVHSVYENNNDYQRDGNKVTYAEKARMIDLEESNIYNLTQNIAETFEVYCKYKYLYDKNYHIIGRIVIFYNNFLLENNNISITYRNNTSSIVRDIDSTDLITKLYVKTTTDDNEITILDAEENDIGEDFLLNFDYLYSIGTVSEESYNYIPTYKEKLQKINSQLKIEFEKRTLIENKLPEVKAKKTTVSDAISLDQENIDTSNKMLLNLTEGTGELEIKDLKPDSTALIKQSDSSGNNYYYINIHRHGVKAETLKIFRSFHASLNDGKALAEEIKTAVPVYDEYNNLIQMKNIYWNEGSKIVYLTYKYEPELYFKNITEMWMKRLENDRKDLEKFTTELNELESQLNEINEKIDILLEEKEKENNYFSSLMGPCLREGYWQPEDYADRGNTFISTYDLSRVDKIDNNVVKINGKTKYDTFLWDTDLFDNEQDITYNLGALQEVEYYPCINLSNIWTFIHTRLDEFSFIFNDTSLITSTSASDGDRRNYSSTLRVLPFGSGAKIVFIKDSNNNIVPALLLIGAETYSEDTLTNMRNNGVIGILTTSTIGTEIYFSIDLKNISQLSWIDLNSTFKVVYPRVKIESLLLKDDDASLSIRYADNNLTKFSDYYINNRSDISDHLHYIEDGQEIKPLIGSTYITIKPEILVKKNDIKDKLKIYFKISDAASYIYLDAITVIEENSMPKVSYELDLNIIKNNFIKQPSLFLSRIVPINDYELKLKNVKGYISEVILSLDKPWEDKVTIQNYTTKFEDLFSNILAQTEEMKKSSYLLDTVANSFSLDGTLLTSTLQGALNRVDLNYAFNNGRLTIDEQNGIWGSSDSGVVAFRGGGIFTSTQKNSSGDWIWNTGITPEGISANLITSGQLDTSKIRIYSGDKVRFQLNGEGLFGYKSFFEDFQIFYDTNYVGTNVPRSEVLNKIKNNGDIDASQFIEFNENGLFLVAKEDAFVLNESKNDYIILTRYYKDDEGTHTRLDEDLELKRVSITWDGLRLRNLKGESVFFANADTGDLRIKGAVYADAFYVIRDEDDEINTTDNLATYVKDTSLTELQTRLRNNTDVGARIKSYINAAATAIGGRYVKAIDDAESKYTQGTSYPDTPSIGDMFYNTSTHKTYLCIATEGSDNEKWQEIVVSDTNTQMNIDSNTGTIAFNSSKSISFSAIENNNGIPNYSVLSITTNGIGMNSNKGIDINGGKISITSATVNGTTINGAIEITSGGTFSAVGNNFWIGAVDYNEWISKTDAQKNDLGIAFIRGYKQNGKYHLEIASSDNLRIASGGSLTLESGSNVSINATGSITLMSGATSAIELSSTGISLASTKTLKIDTNNFKLRPDIVFDTTNGNYNNVFFYVGATFDSSNQNPSHYIKYSAGKGLQIKTTNFLLDPTATDDVDYPHNANTRFKVGGDDNYLKYMSDGSIEIKGTITVTGGNAMTESDVESLGYQTANQVTTITENTIKTTSVVAENLKVKGANIEDLVIGVSSRQYAGDGIEPPVPEIGDETFYLSLKLLGDTKNAGMYYYIDDTLKASMILAKNITLGDVTERDGVYLETKSNISLFLNISEYLVIDTFELYLYSNKIWTRGYYYDENTGTSYSNRLTSGGDFNVFTRTGLLIFNNGICTQVIEGNGNGYTGGGWVAGPDSQHIYLYFENGVLTGVVPNDEARDAGWIDF